MAGLDRNSDDEPGTRALNDVPSHAYAETAVRPSDPNSSSELTSRRTGLAGFAAQRSKARSVMS